jgi:cytochrome c
MGRALTGRLSCAAVLAALLALAGCKDQPDSSSKAPAANTATTAVAAPGATQAPVAGTTLGGEALARARTCLACHQVDRKQVGPAYQDVAARFAGNPEAVTILSNAIRKGGRGQWGAVPMPAQPQVSEAEAAELARWILTLKP